MPSLTFTTGSDNQLYVEGDTYSRDYTAVGFVPESASMLFGGHEVSLDNLVITGSNISFTVPAPFGGTQQIGNLHIEDAGEVNDLVVDAIGISPLTVVTWTYSNKTAFVAFNGPINTAIETDPDRTGNGIDAYLLSAGQRGDTYIDSRLAGMLWPVSLTGMDTRTTALMQDISNHAARWQLAEAHQFGLVTGQSVADDDETKLAKSDKAYVDRWLSLIEETPSILVATGAPTGSEDFIIDAPVTAGPTVDPNGVALRYGRYWWQL